MGRLVEAVGVRFSLCCPQVHKVNAVGIGFCHLDKGIILTYAVGTGTETESVMQAVYRFFQPLHVLLRGDNARQAKNWTGRIIRMDGQLNADFFRHRHDGAQKGGHMLAQPGFINTVVLRQLCLKLFERITLFCTG